MDIKEIKELKRRSIIIRKRVIESVYAAASGHSGGALSCVDILSVLYFKEMKVDSQNPKDPNRDRLVLSKGHATPALYSTLAEKGYFPIEELSNFRQACSYLSGHPDMKGVPGVDMSTGSLGQGLSVANGMALAAKLDKKNYRVYAILGDGEIQEGQIWEAAMTAAHYKLDNVCAFIDNNGLQIDGRIEDVMSPEPIGAKFQAFGWNVLSIDGHDVEQIISAVNIAKSTRGKPTVVICKTIKGKGAACMEDKAESHAYVPNKQERDQAIAEFDKLLANLEV